MVLLRICLNNLLLFRDFDLCLSYPKKIVNSTIDGENLDGRRNFRYRKLVVLMGANATGKTALGKTLMGIFNFIATREAVSVFKLVDNKSKPAFFSLDIAFANHVLYRVSAYIRPLENSNSEYGSDGISVSIKQVNIRSNDSYETCSERFETAPVMKESHYTQSLETLPHLTWGFEYPFASSGKQRVIQPVDQHLYSSVLGRCLKALDPRIISVSEIEQTKNTYMITYPNHTIIINNGTVLEQEKLSSGTNEIIGVSQMITAMKLGTADFFYCDEKFSHVHSDMEKAFLSTMIALLRGNQQLFFTTHNPDILDMNIPKHSFAFFRRNNDDDKGVNCVFASDYLKKNTDSLRNAVENDLFFSSPETDDILRLAE